MYVQIANYAFEEQNAWQAMMLTATDETITSRLQVRRLQKSLGGLWEKLVESNIPPKSDATVDAIEFA